MRQVLRAGWCLSAVCVLSSTLVVLSVSLITSDRAVQRAIARCLPLTVLNFCFHATAVTSEGALLATRDLRFLCTWYAGLGVAVLAAHRSFCTTVRTAGDLATYFGCNSAVPSSFRSGRAWSRGRRGRGGGRRCVRFPTAASSPLRVPNIGAAASVARVTTIRPGARRRRSLSGLLFPRGGARGEPTQARRDAAGGSCASFGLSIPVLGDEHVKVMRSVIVPISTMTKANSGPLKMFRARSCSGMSLAKSTSDAMNTSTI